MANAGVEYMVTQVRILSRPIKIWGRDHGNVVKALTDFVAID
jgi:hypothetical protein